MPLVIPAPGVWPSRIILFMGLQKYPLGGFLGGMNLIDNPYSLEKNEAELALNVDLGIRDVLSSRKGFSEAGLAAELKSQTKTPTVVEGLGFPGRAPWVNPANAKVSDNVYAVATKEIAGGSAQLIDTARGTNYGFSLPATAIVVGVQFNPEVKEGGVESGVSDFEVHLVKAGAPVGENLASGTKWGPFDNSRTYGGPTSLWGTTVSKAEVEGAQFGIDFGGIFSLVGGIGFQAFIDAMPITVYYIVPGIGTDVVTHMRPWYTGANRYLLLSANGKIKLLKEGTTSTLFTGTAGTTWYFEPIEYQAGNEEILLCMNGVDTPRYINQKLEVKEWKGATKIVPKGSMCRVWKGHVMISGDLAHPQRVYMSDPFNPFTPDDESNGGYGTNYVDIGTGEDDVDPVTWLEIIDDVLLVFKKKSTWAIYSDAPPLGNYRIANVGCEGRFLSCVLDERVYFANRYGVYSVGAEGAQRYESINVEPMFKGESPVGVPNVALANMGSARMAASASGRVYLTVPTLSGTGAPITEYMLEGYPRLRGALRRRGDERTPFILHHFAKRSLTSICIYRREDGEVDKLVAGLTNELRTSAELVRMFYSERDGLEPIEWRWRSGRKPEISEEPFERIRRVNLLMKGKVEVEVTSDQQSFGPESLESTVEEVKRVKPETWGRYHQVELSDSSQTATSIYDIEVAFRGGKEH